MRYPKVGLDQWRVLMAVVDEGGYAQAADALHKSQSTVSYSIKQMQEALGVSVLEVEGRKARLTATGHILLARARPLVESALNIEDLAQSLAKGWEAQVRLAVDGAFPKRLLMQALAEFEPKSQGCRVELREEVLSGAEEAVVRREVDLAITPFVPVGSTGSPLLDVDFICVAHPQHKLHKLGRAVTEEDLSNHTQVVIRDSGQSRTRDSGWFGAKQRWTVSSIEGAMQIVASGLGFSWLPTCEILREEFKSSLLPLNLQNPSIKRATLYLVFARPSEQGPALELLAEAIRKVARALTAS